MSGIVAAIVAVITLGTFYILQDYGPASAIRRFHEAIFNNDVGELQQVTYDKINSPAVRELITAVNSIGEPASHPQVARMDRQVGEVRAAVVYTYPNNLRTARVWVVEKHDKLWQVNAEKTVAIWQMGL